MTHPEPTLARTGLLLVDPYNDFLSPGGKLFPLLEGVAQDVHLLDNLRKCVASAREHSQPRRSVSSLWRPKHPRRKHCRRAR